MFFVFLGLAIADLLFLGLWLVLGFGVDGAPAAAERHQVGGLMVCILTCFVHAVTFVYFLGTGLAIKEARKNWGIDPGYVRHTRRFKLVAYPPAMLAIGLIITTGVLGGAVRAGDASPVVHRVFAVTALVASAFAFFVAARLVLRNGYMMGIVRGEIDAIRRSVREGGTGPRLENGATPELLRPQEEVKKPPSGFLAGRALLFLGASAWLLYAYLQWFLDVGEVSWLPFAVLSLVLVAAGLFLWIRHPLPADVDF
jgi:hypothetical protein